jgi:hypothetical protein
VVDLPRIDAPREPGDRGVAREHEAPPHVPARPAVGLAEHHDRPRRIATREFGDLIEQQRRALGRQVVAQAGAGQLGRSRNRPVRREPRPSAGRSSGFTGAGPTSISTAPPSTAASSAAMSSTRAPESVAGVGARSTPVR